MVKFQSFDCKLVSHKIKKVTGFNLIRPHLQKNIILEMFISTPPSILRLSLNYRLILVYLLQWILCVKSFSYISSVWAGPVRTL